jgi:drug/metabolite transporter (DMT)-like permease
MAGVRFLIAGVAMLVIIGPRHATGVRRPGRHEIRSVIVVAALLLVGGNGLLSVGETELNSGLAALLVATVPIWMVLVNAVKTRTRITAGVVAALALGTVGVGVLMGGPGSEIHVGGAVVVLVASVFWAVGSVYARTAPLPANPLVSTSLEMIAGGLMLLVLGVVAGELGRLDFAAVSTRSLLGLLWLIVAGSMVAFSAYIYANTNLPNELVSTYAYVNPVVAVVLGALLDQEPVGLNLLLGGGIIVSSVVVIVSGHALRSRAERRVRTTGAARDS